MPQSFINHLAPDIHFETPDISIMSDKIFIKKKIEVSLLRLDQIHPVISGNKIFKLFYFLEEAIKSSHKTIITFGGAYSNHLAATAFACNKTGIKSIGFVRGEKPKIFSPILLFCAELGMQLEFLTRTFYRNVEDKNFLFSLKEKYGPHTLIPEGGFSDTGARGASLITQFFPNNKYTHICVAVGTATTFAGIINRSSRETEVIGFSVLKNMTDIKERLKKLNANPQHKYSFKGDYHFAGYAKKTSELISFINSFYEQHSIPLDFVYTGKMMFGVYDLIKKNYFPANSKILCIHTGGLQGNKSLPERTLIF